MIRRNNVFRLGVKELWSLVRDPIMLVLIAYTFTVAIYVAATAMPESLHNAPIAIVDEKPSHDQLCPRAPARTDPPATEARCRRPRSRRPRHAPS